MTDNIDKLAEALELIQKRDVFWTLRRELTSQSITVDDHGKGHSVLVLGDCGKIAREALAAHREAKAQPHDPLPQNCVHGVSDENGNVIDCGEPLPCKYHDKAQPQELPGISDADLHHLQQACIVVSHDDLTKAVVGKGALTRLIRAAFRNTPSLEPQEPGEFDELVEEANRHIKLRLLKGDLKSKLIEAITTLQARVREANEATKWATRRAEQAEQQVLTLENAEDNAVKLIDSIFPDETGGGMQRIIVGIKALKDQADEARAKALEEAANKVKQLIVYDDTGESANKARFGAVEAIIALTPAGREEG